MADKYDELDNAVETKPVYATWGECNADMFEAVWPQGANAAERFDPSIHQASSKFWRVEIIVIPLDEMQSLYNAEFKGNATGYNNHDWSAVVAPSIKALGISSRDIDKKYVKIIKKPNGRFYIRKNGPKAGEKAELTDFLFVKVFASQDACLADYLETKAGDPVSAASADAFPADVPVTPPGAVASAVPADAILIKFARALVTGAAKQAPGDLAAITELVKTQIDKNPMLAGKYSVDTEPVVSMLIAAVA